MTLTKQDLQAIKSIVNDELTPVKKDVQFLKKKATANHKELKFIRASLNATIENVESHLGLTA